MKRCPSCALTYTDDSLVFCLQDGSSLVIDTSTSSPLAATLIIPESRTTIPAGPDISYPSVGPAQQPQPQQYPAQPPAWAPQINPRHLSPVATPQGRGLAVSSLVCAIAAFVMLGFCIIGGATGVDESLIGGIFIFTALLGLAGALLGIMSLVRAGRDPNPENSKVLAAVGLVLNGIYLLIVVIFLVVGAVASSSVEKAEMKTPRLVLYFNSHAPPRSTL